LIGASGSTLNPSMNVNGILNQDNAGMRVNASSILNQDHATILNQDHATFGPPR
jgi:hypothetical protein